MKRAVVLVLLAVIICLSMISCNIGGLSTVKCGHCGKQNTEGSIYCQSCGKSISNTDDLPQFDNYGGNMTLNAYNAECKDSLDLYSVGYWEDEYVLFYFDLGLIKRAPVYTSLALEYKEQNVSLVMKFNALTEESLENSISESVEIIDTHSYTGGFKLGFQQEVDVGAKILGTGLKAKFTTSQETDHHWTKNWGDITTTSESTKNGYIQTYSEGYELTLDFSEENGFKKGYSYRVSFYETIRSFGVLYYNVETDEFTVAFENMLVPNQTRMVIEESNDESGEFDYNLKKTIDFDVDEAIKIAKSNMPQKDSSIHIRSEQEFFNNMRASTFGKTYVVDLDEINLANYTGPRFPEFKGVLDGQGCELKNWKYVYTTIGNIGLFEGNSGTIKNFTINEFEISNNDPDIYGTLNAGLLCGSNSGQISDIKIKNSNISVDVGNFNNPNDNYAYVGTICGYNTGVVDNCEISGCILSVYAGTQYEGARAYVGGTVGYSTAGKISNVVSSGNTIDATAKANVNKNWIGAEVGHGRPYAYVGGIVGFSDNTDLEINLIVDGNTIGYTIDRDCGHDTNKGGGGRNDSIKGN